MCSGYGFCAQNDILFAQSSSTGCGTMGIAIISGILQSLDPESRLGQGREKWELHTPGTRTPTESDPSIPSRFIACVRLESSANKLRSLFSELGGLGSNIQVSTSQNVESVRQSDVILLWSVSGMNF
jgi:pyrroline-5-carboxylate reductase